MFRSVLRLILIKTHMLPESTPVLDDQSEVCVLFEYPWLPVKCEICKKERQTSHDCPQHPTKPAPKQEWMAVSKGKKIEQSKMFEATEAPMSGVLMLEITDVSKIPVVQPAKDIQVVQHKPSPSLLIGNSFATLDNAAETDAAAIPKVRKTRMASKGVAIATNALVPRQRQSRKSSNSSSEAIHCHVLKTSINQYQFLSVIYANPYSDSLRQEMWRELVALSQALPAVPWLVEGEFNEIKSLCSFFTWSNKKCIGPTGKKLNRLLVNEFWLNAFPNTTAAFFRPGCSDHDICGN
ncbi:hypothetical protein SLEP1_g40796 [Rubroshorea leprosula]|uniref:Uncharacterized protein n=1 Tax=Rubroshorea leprosula TaxID=152421 RepID=A0AAV5L4I6_9ROSI|nr:hypothetical protein SLEP1_g40796 [Rubroshorea leprosula]